MRIRDMELLCGGRAYLTEDMVQGTKSVALGHWASDLIEVLWRCTAAGYSVPYFVAQT